MIVEQRDYHVFTGKLNEVVSMYESEGIELQRKHLGDLVGVFTRTSARCRPTQRCGRTTATPSASSAAPACRPTRDWKDFLARLQPLLHTQQNRILIPTSFSPLR